MSYKISGTKSETARIIILKESDWSMESNTTVSGYSAYEVDVVSGTKSIIARASDGEVKAYGNVSSKYSEPLPTWVSHFDNTDWEITPATGHGSWDTDHWVSEYTFDSRKINLQELGTWVEGFRPTKVRLTHTHTSGIYFNMIDVDGNTMMSESNYTSLVEINLTFVEPFDILVLNTFVPSNGTAYNITDIEFYG